MDATWLADLADVSEGFVLGRDYPQPIVEHEQARAETLARYAVVKDKDQGKSGEKASKKLAAGTTKRKVKSR